jgi:hypothetical protein
MLGVIEPPSNLWVVSWLRALSQSRAFPASCPCKPINQASCAHAAAEIKVRVEAHPCPLLFRKYGQG